MTEERKPHPRVEGIEDFATLMSCLDYRLDDFGINRTNKHTYVDRLRVRVERGQYRVVHLSFLRPLGIAVAAGVVEDRELQAVIRTSGFVDNSMLEKLGVPKPHLAWNIIMLNDGRLFVSWYKPIGMGFDDVRGWVEERGEWLGTGWKLPVHTCLPRPREEDIPLLAKRFNELLAQPLLRIRAPIIAYILVALLDKYPLAPLRQIASLSMVAAARDLDNWLRHVGITERLRWRFIYRYYRTLSTHYVVGRYRLIYPTQLQRGLPILVEGHADMAEQLYGVFALFKGAHMFLTEKQVIATLRLPPEDAARLMALINRIGGRIGSYSKVYHFPLPFEYYDPIENRWREERVDEIPSALRKLRYIISST